MRHVILPYRQGSKGARSLAEALGGRVLLLSGSRYAYRSGDQIINWGYTGPLDGMPIAGQASVILNHPDTIKNASNKLRFFRRMKEADLSSIIPPFWENKADIPETTFEKGGLVVCRTVLAGHSGDGIVIASSHGDLVPASLYVKYIKKKDEYRVHVGHQIGYPYSEGGDVTVISVQRKARRSDCENPNWQVRNHDNGFVFVRQNVNPPASVLDAAKKALVASGLDFGAVDVIFNEQEGKAYVLEINTAPGLEGQTVEDYASFFKQG